MKASLFFARRFMGSIKKEHGVSALVLVCFCAIVVGSYTLAVIAAVMDGFSETTRLTFQNINCDITLSAPEKKSLSFKKIAPVLSAEFSDTVAHAAPIAENYALVKTASGATQIVFVHGIDWTHDKQTRALATTVCQPFDEKLFDNNAVLLGSLLADMLQVKVGDTISLAFSPDARITKDNTCSFCSREAHVVGTFKTGLDEIDGGALFCPLPWFAELFPRQGVTSIGIKLKKNAPVASVITRFKERFGVDAYTWEEQYPAIVSALSLEKYVTVCIVALITLAAGINSIALLLMFLQRKRHQIAALLAMGVSRATIAGAFVLINLCIVLAGCAVGLLGAFATTWWLNTYKYIQLPTAYYVDYLPATMHLSTVFTVLALNVLVGVLAAAYAASRIYSLNIHATLKEEQ